MPVTVLRDADIFTADADHRVLAGGWLAIDDGRIIDLGPAGTAPPISGSGDHVIDLHGHALIPGLVNAHTHSPMILFRGRAESHSLLTMEGWWQAIREPELHLIAEDIRPAAAMSYAEMAASGTTLVADQYFFANEVRDAAADSGLRAVIAYGIVELGDRERGDRELAAAIDFVEQTAAAGNDRLRGWIGPHAPFIDNSAELLKAEVAAANAHDVGLHLHMAVGPEDNEQTLAEYGVTAAVALANLGFFSARVLAAHCLDLSQADIDAFAAARAAAIVQCPTAGLRSGRTGIAPVVALREAGVTVALGTDNMAANNSYDLFTEMKVAGLAAAHREQRAGALPADQLLQMATIDGARALGLEHETGSLEIGKAADLVAIDLRGLGYTPAPDLATLLVFSGSGRDVRHVMVAGEWIVRDGALTRSDPRQLRDDYAQTYERYWDRVSAAARK